MSKWCVTAVATMIATALPAFSAGTGTAAPRVPAMAAQPMARGPMAALSPAALIGQEQCVSFNPMTVSWMGGPNAMVMASGKPLVQFGGAAVLAQHAASVIHSYGFDQQCFASYAPNAFVGMTGMMYWKAAGHVPANQLADEKCVAFDPSQAVVAQSGSNWAVKVSNGAIVNTGPDKAAADRALVLIKGYRLSRLCRIGMQMTYWLRDP